MFRGESYFEPAFQLCGEEDHQADQIPVRVIERVYRGDDPEPERACAGFFPQFPEGGLVRLLPLFDSPGDELPKAGIERIIRGTADEEVLSPVPLDPERTHLYDP
jgi:hypothetical protein